MMEFIKEIFLQNAFSSLKLSAVIILLFVLTKPITKHYTAGFRYYSWLAVMLIFLIPFTKLGIDYTIKISPSVTSRIISMRSLYEVKVPEYSVTEEYVDYEHKEQNTTVEKKPQRVQVIKITTEKKLVDVTAVLAIIWLIGILGYFTLHYGRYVYLRHELKRLSNRINDKHICECLDFEREQLGISKPLKIRYSQLIDTPMLVRLFKSEIILPQLDYTDDELRLIFRHELIHFKRCNILYQLIILIFVSLHWFNPIVHLMAKEIEIDGETSCDEKTLEGKEYDEKIFYGDMLIKFLKTQTQKKSYMTTTFFGGKKGMKKRLTLIVDKKVRRKGTVAMVIIMITAIIISISVAAMDNEYFNSVFEGDTSYLTDFVKTEKKSVEDNRFRLTLEQYLIAENQAMIVCSFEAKTEDAKQEMNAVDERGIPTFNGMDFLNFVPTDYEKAYIRSCSVGHLGEGKYDTEVKKYYILKSDDIRNEECVDFRLITDRIKGKQPIIVPMDYNMKTNSVEFNNITVKYNPISIEVSYPASDEAEDCDRCGWYGTYFYFRMKNGEIKTFTQLYENSGSNNEYDENDNLISTSKRAWARSIIEPDEIKSIIVNDTEYPVDNPLKSTSVRIDDRLKPFMINAYVKEHLWLPLSDFCNGLGAEMTFDSDTKSANVKFRGSEYVFTAGSTKVLINGETVDFYDGLNDNTTFIDENGRMIISARIDEYMGVYAHGYNFLDENDNIKSDAKWHIIP